MSAPRIGIALATYKPDLNLLRLQLESIRAQTFENWFVVVHDDCSTELEALTDFVLKILGSDKAKVLSGAKRQGAVGNFSSAMAAIPANCELVATCDQDDEWESSKLAHLAKFFDNSKVMAVHSDLAVIDRDGRKLQESCWKLESRDPSANDPFKYIMRNPVTGCALMFRRSLLKTALPIPEQPIRKPYYYHDVWLALVALKQGEVAPCERALTLYRQHDSNSVGVEKRSGTVGFSLSNVAKKCVTALRTRRELEDDWCAKIDPQASRLFTATFNLGIPILLRTLRWSLFSSKGYLKIGLQLTLGKLLWDFGFRDGGSRE